MGDKLPGITTPGSGRRGPSSPSAGAEVHLGDNYSHLLRSTADLAGRAGTWTVPPLVLYIDDHLPLNDRLRDAVARLTGAEVVRVSDRGAIEAFARLPRFAPGIIRRNLSWSGRHLVTAGRWTPVDLTDRRFDTAYVYHPGFFLSKVVAGRSRRVVMRDSGYSNYVSHRVPLHRALPRVLAGRSPVQQVWGEEPWVDEIEVVRPDQVPERVRHKATRRTLDDMMAHLSDEIATSVALAFWGEAPLPETASRRVALVLTQPIDALGICTSAEKRTLYESIVSRVRELGYDVVVKPHPREPRSVLADLPHLPAEFPIEAWAWLGPPPFELAVSLNSTALADERVSFARRRVQLVPPDRFYGTYWAEWPTLADQAFATITS